MAQPPATSSWSTAFSIKKLTSVLNLSTVASVFFPALCQWLQGIPEFAPWQLIKVLPSWSSLPEPAWLPSGPALMVWAHPGWLRVPVWHKAASSWVPPLPRGWASGERLRQHLPGVAAVVVAVAAEPGVPAFLPAFAVPDLFLHPRPCGGRQAAAAAVLVVSLVGLCSRLRVEQVSAFPGLSSHPICALLLLHPLVPAMGHAGPKIAG